MKKILLVLLLTTNAFAVELLMINDISKYEEGRILQIDNAISVEAPDNKISFKLNPGEKKSIIKGNVRSFVLTRIFNRHKVKYDVLCPKNDEGNFKINLLKVHNNELPGGCKVVRTGHRSKHTGMNWEVTDKDGWKDLQGERRGTNLRR